MKYLRFATYLLLLVTVFSTDKVRYAIPLSLRTPVVDANDWALAESKRSIKDGSILQCDASGNEVSRIAESIVAPIRDRGVRSLSDVPKVEVKRVEDEVFWILTYAVIYPPPGESTAIVIVVSDRTREVVSKRGI